MENYNNMKKTLVFLVMGIFVVALVSASYNIEWGNPIKSNQDSIVTIDKLSEPYVFSVQNWASWCRTQGTRIEWRTVYQEEEVCVPNEDQSTNEVTPWICTIEQIPFTYPEEVKDCDTADYQAYVNSIATAREIDIQEPVIITPVETIDGVTNIDGTLTVGIILADVYVDKTPFYETFTLPDAYTKLTAIQQNQDGTIDDATLPIRWQVLVNGVVRRDTTTMQSDFIGIFIMLMDKMQEQNNRLNTIEQETCAKDPTYSWC